MNKAKALVSLRSIECYPEVPVIAINGASREVKAFALFSYHPIRFQEAPYRWAYWQRKKFGNDFTIHGSKHEDGMPWVNHWWEGARGGGGSIWGARKLAYLMGFDEVILCGSPMEVGPYTGNHNFGGLMHRQDVIERYRKEIEMDKDWHDGCLSMSGWTREFLGCP